MNLATNGPLTRSPHIRDTHNQDGAVLLDCRGGKCYPLNQVAALIWKQLGEGLTPLQVAENVARTCNVSIEMATADVMDFVEALVAAKIVLPRRSVPMSGPARWARWTELLYKLWPRIDRADKTTGGTAGQRDAVERETQRRQPWL